MKNTINKTKQHGGKRYGSGRKPLPETKKISYATRLRPDQVKWLRSQQNAAQILEVLIDDAMAGLAGL